MILLNDTEKPQTTTELGSRGSEAMPDEIFLAGVNAGSKAQVRKIAEWGNGLCPHFAPIIELKRGCFDCWQELRKECE